MLAPLYPLKTVFMVSIIIALVFVLSFQNYLNYILSKVVSANNVSDPLASNGSLASNNHDDGPLASKIDDDSVACVVPKLDPWDPMIMEWISHPSSYVCDQVQRNLTYIDYEGYLQFDERELEYLNDSGVTVRCWYRTFDRCCGLNDSCIHYDDEKELIEPTKLSGDMVDVKCWDGDDEQIYWNIHAHPIKTDDRIFAKPTDDQLSVLLIILDSIAYSSLQRNMPLTYNYTKTVMGSKYFEAYTKVGDHTHSNLLPILTGKRVYEEQDDMKVEVHFDNGQDNYPLIWDMFSGKGYSTMWNEDKPLWGLFNHLDKGFKQNPVDFRYRPFWLAVVKAQKKSYSSYCFANIPRPYLLIDTMKRHLVTMNDSLQFIYTHFVECCHDEESESEMLDEQMMHFFKEMYEKNYFNKTVVIFAADHGLRFGDLRATILGLMEERLPFYSLWFPRWFYDLHPEIEKNIDSNKNILSSNFDVYETMIDILNANYHGVQRESSSRGQSQLYPLPKGRTCKQAGVPDNYCACLYENSLNVTHPAAVSSGKALVAHLNLMLKNHSNICETIVLTEVLHATQIELDKKMVMDEIKINQIRIGILTEPHQGRFEALMKKNTTTNNTSAWTVDSGISRTTKYAGLSDCMKDKQLEKICSCKNLDSD